MGRRNGTPESKRVLVDAFLRLHELHFCPGVIGKVTGYSDGYVRKLLDAEGRKERWNDSADVLKTLPSDLADLCQSLRNKAVNH